MLYAVSSAATQSETVPDRETYKMQTYTLFTLDKFVNGGTICCAVSAEARVRLIHPVGR